MNTTIVNATEYRDLPLNLLTESTTNPRRQFDEASLKELAETIRSQGVLSPLLVRPLQERGFEIVFGARRYRAAQMAEVATVPVRIKNLTDAEVLEAQLIESHEQYGYAARDECFPLDDPQFES
jgi:ParB family transcriptional regulator, chromosome partitioning protein